VNFLPDESWVVTNTVSGDTLATGTNTSGDFNYPIINGFMPRIISATKPASIYQILATDSLDPHGGLTRPRSTSRQRDRADITGFNFNDAFNHDYEIRSPGRPSSTEYNFGDPSPQAASRCRSASSIWGCARSRMPRTMSR
jgi:hypothetical protein